LDSFVSSFSVDTLSWIEYVSIPNKHVCSRAPYNVSFPFGMNVSPGIGISRPPPATKSMIVLLHDQDTVPYLGYALLHWGVIDLPATTEVIPEDASLTPFMPRGSTELPNGIVQELWGINGYLGPCPMSNTNFYRVTVFARNITKTVNLPLTGDAGLIIATLMGDGLTIAVAETMAIFP